MFVDVWDFGDIGAFDWNRIWEVFEIDATSDYMSLNVPLWFLLTLFVIQGICLVILRLPRWCVVALAIAAILLKPVTSTWATPFMINNALYWISFFALGFVIGKPYIRLISNRRAQISMFTACLVALAVTWGWLNATQLPDLGGLVTDLHYLSFTMVFMTFLSFFNGIPQLEILRFFGKNSLIVLGAHLWILIPVGRVMFKLTRVHDPLLGLTMAVITAGLLVPLIKFLNRRVPYLVGKESPEKFLNPV